MKSKLVLFAVCCLAASVGLGRMHGKYTINPDGSGNFTNFQDVGIALVDSGIDGNCVFEAYSGTYEDPLEVSGVSGNDTWGITFRNAPGELPLIATDEFSFVVMNRVTLESLAFEFQWPTFDRCTTGAVRNCRMDSAGAFDFLDCSDFTVTGNVLRNLGEFADVEMETCTGFTFANNIIGVRACFGNYGVFNVWSSPGLRFYYNTMVCPSDGSDTVSCILFEGDPPADVRDNIFVLGSGCDEFSSCVRVGAQPPDTASLDFNCYFVDSAGCVANWQGSQFLDFADWQALGYDAHGQYADPLFDDSLNLHLQPGSPCIGAGVPIPGFATDIDGDPRDPQHPCVGADEYTVGGVTEGWRDEGGRMKEATVLRSLPAGAVAFDAMGRRVTNPRAGIYFVFEPQASSHKPQAVRKVVVQR